MKSSLLRRTISPISQAAVLSGILTHINRATEYDVPEADALDIILDAKEHCADLTGALRALKNKKLHIPGNKRSTL